MKSIKRGITLERKWNRHDDPIVVIRKARGKLTLEEIQGVLLYSERQEFCGHYAILLNCSETAMGGSGWFDEEADKGDAVSLFSLDDLEGGQDHCPICGDLLPPEYCPECGASLRD